MPPYCTSRPNLFCITAVVAFGVRDGTGQYARDRCVRVGTFFANASRRDQDIDDDGCDRDRWVSFGIGAERD